MFHISCFYSLAQKKVYPFSSSFISSTARPNCTKFFKTDGTFIGSKFCEKNSERSVFLNSVTNRLHKKFEFSVFHGGTPNFDCLSLFQISINFDEILAQGRVDQ